jgi:predicted trehalose synthase
MPYHSLLNNDEAGDVDVFEAVRVECRGCGGDVICRTTDDLVDCAHHKRGCRYKGTDEVELKMLTIGWAYAYGSEGYAWNDDAVGSYATEDDALGAANANLHDELDEAARASGFAADGREVA